MDPDQHVASLVESAEPQKHTYEKGKKAANSANLVYRVNFNIDSIDLKKVARQVPEGKYDSTKFAAFIVRRGLPQSCALVFSTALAVINGVKTLRQVEIACQKSRVRAPNFDVGANVGN